MKLKCVRLVGGIPNAKATAAHREYGGENLVMVTISAIDGFEIPSVVLNLTLRVDEAEDLAKRIIAAAHSRPIKVE